MTPDPEHTLPLNLLSEVPLTAVYQVALEPSGRVWFPYISSGIEDILGVTPDEVYRSDTLLHDLIHEADLPVYLSAWNASIHGLVPFQVVVRQRDRRGGYRYSLLRSRPSREADGRITWNGIQMDVTAQVSPGDLERGSAPGTELLTVCAWCTRYRGVDGAWYHTGGLLGLFGRDRVTHGVCDECAKAFA